MIFPQVEEIGATLWGAVFMYDFLGEHKLIDAVARENVQKAIATLKQDFFNGLGSSAWKAAFVVRAWPKADSVSQIDFEAEVVQFQASFTKLVPHVEQQALPFDNFFDVIIPDPGSKPRSMYEKVFGHNPPTRSKKKRKKKKR